MRQFDIIVSDACKTSDIVIGRQGETNVTKIVFSLAEWFDYFGDGGNVTMLYQRPSDTSPYPLLNTEINYTDKTLTWLVSATDTANKGIGECEMRYSVGDALVKSKIFSVNVACSLGDGTTPPDPWESWLEQILAAAEEAQGYAEDAEESADRAEEASERYPYIRESDKHWMVWDAVAGEYVDTGVVAEGHGGGGGTGDHRELTNRDAADQHPMTAITGLPEALAGKQPSGDYALESDIPTQLAELSGDTAHRTVTDTEKSSWDAKQNALTPDVDYATPEAVQQDISDATTDMATETWVNGQGYITDDDIPVLSVNGKTGVVVLTASDLGIGSVFELKGSVATKTALPTTGNKAGDVYYVIDESVGYIWLNDGTVDRWEMLGMSVDLSNYVTTTALATALSGYVAKVAGKGLSTNDFTDAYKTKLDAAITSLAGYATEQWVEGKGYLTEHQSLSAYRTASAQDVIDGNKQPKITASGILKGDGAGGVSAAVAGTDFMSAEDPSGRGNMVIGTSNTIGSSYKHNTIFGTSNKISGDRTFVSGTSNTIYIGANAARILGTNNEVSSQCIGAYIEGRYCKANEQYQHVQGQYNYADSTKVDIVGYGTSNSARKNIEATDKQGNKYLTGDVYVHCNDDSTGGSKLMTEAITDAGGYFSATTVEAALQEIGAELAGINTLIGSGVI